MPILAEPPIYTQMDLKYRVTLLDVLDAHELIALRAALRDNEEKRLKDQQGKIP